MTATKNVAEKVPRLSLLATETFVSSNPISRSFAASALGLLGNDARAAVPALLKVAKDKESSVRQNVVRALGKFGTEAKDPILQVIAESLLAVHAVLLREFKEFEKRLRLMARSNQEAQLLMSAPGVGAIVALTVASAIDDPARFKSSKQVGAHFGMTPKKYQSGETDITGRISKIGDKGVRTALYQAAHIVLTKPVKGSVLKSWAMRLAKRVGMKKAKVALARKLAVILHRMLADRKPFAFTAAAAA